MEDNGLVKEAKKLTRRIVESYEPDEVRLFGSGSRDEAGVNSDIDLFIVKESDKKRPFRVKEVFEVLRGVERRYPLDVIVYTPEEVESRLAKGDFFVRNVFLEGRVLYERG